MPALPTDTVFSRSDARTLGWSDSSLSRALQSGRAARIRRGAFRVAEVGEPGLPEHVRLHRAAVAAAVAAQRACQGSFVSHRSAALMHGLPLLGELPSRPDLTVPPRSTGDVAHALLHRARVRDEDVVQIDGTPVLSVARTVLDLARSAPHRTAIAAADAALFRQLTSVEAVLDVRDMCRGWPGMRRARQALVLVDGRAESPLETVSRLVFSSLNLPMPAIQTVVIDSDGAFVGRLDFSWDEYGAAGEADGRSKYTERTVLFAEKTRQERLEDAGLVVTRWGWREVTEPRLLQRKVHSALLRGQQRDAAGIPRGWRSAPTSPLLIPW